MVKWSSNESVKLELTTVGLWNFYFFFFWSHFIYILFWWSDSDSSQHLQSFKYITYKLRKSKCYRIQCFREINVRMPRTSKNSNSNIKELSFTSKLKNRTRNIRITFVWLIKKVMFFFTFY